MKAHECYFKYIFAQMYKSISSPKGVNKPIISYQPNFRAPKSKTKPSQTLIPKGTRSNCRKSKEKKSSSCIVFYADNLDRCSSPIQVQFHFSLLIFVSLVSLFFLFIGEPKQPYPDIFCRIRYISRTHTHVVSTRVFCPKLRFLVS